MLKLTFISDTHSKHNELPQMSGDVLIHCGDITKRGELDVLRSFSKFMQGQDFKHKIVIAGNHDFCLEDDRSSESEGILKEHGLIYLNDSGVEIEGVKFWGSPVQPIFFDWAFNRERGPEIKRHWDLIPEGTDVLITHGPPLDLLDECVDGKRVGCEDLREAVLRLRPRIHAFGHIHESYGQELYEGIQFINACTLDLSYRVINAPVSANL